MSSPLRRTVRGMRDLLPEEAEHMRLIEMEAREVARLYGYREVITPLIEHYELLAAKIGEENRKRMYVFEDLGGRRVALRPEFTASIARLVSTKMVAEPKPIRLFSVGSLYRYDEPQFGRYREFWQANYELIGSSRPEADAEILSISNDLLRKTGLKDYYFKIGHVGVLRGILSEEGVKEAEQNRIMQLLDKKMQDEALNILKKQASERCLETLRRLFKVSGREWSRVIKEMNASVEGYEEASSAVENLEAILNLVSDAKMDLNVRVEAGFARGLEYYTGMIFEVYVPGMDIALGGGGRYDRLIELFGGGPTPASGVALGIDRIMLAVKGRRPGWTPTWEGLRVLVLPVNEEVKGKAMELSSRLREKGVAVEVEVMGRKVSRALSDASRRRITHVVIIGPKELREGKVVLRDMKNKEQRTVTVDEVADMLEGLQSGSSRISL